MKEVKRPVVSVVVPVYNTEPFLAECLHSLEKQTLTDIEIILVNDGSTDNSGRLLREYAGKDARFVYVEQENQGLSAARNTGMEHASGHYLAFLDSDDWLAENALQVLCAIAAKTRTDIVSGNTLAVHADGQVQSWERRGRELFATGRCSHLRKMQVDKKYRNINSYDHSRRYYNFTFSQLHDHNI